MARCQWVGSLRGLSGGMEPLHQRNSQYWYLLVYPRVHVSLVMEQSEWPGHEKLAYEDITTDKANHMEKWWFSKLWKWNPPLKVKWLCWLIMGKKILHGIITWRGHHVFWATLGAWHACLHHYDPLPKSMILVCSIFIFEFVCIIYLNYLLLGFVH